MCKPKCITLPKYKFNTVFNYTRVLGFYYSETEQCEENVYRLV